MISGFGTARAPTGQIYRLLRARVSPSLCHPGFLSRTDQTGDEELNSHERHIDLFAQKWDWCRHVCLSSAALSGSLRSCVVLALRQMLILDTGSPPSCHVCECNLKQLG